MNNQPSTPDLCDAFPEHIKVVDPIFHNYGGKDTFFGKIVTVKCFEDNSKVKDLADTDGRNKVMVVDAGASMRRACLGDMLAEKATHNGWQGILMYGCIRDVEIIAKIDIGVKALGVHPQKTDKKDIGDINMSVIFAGVEFIPGHFLYADLNGVIVSPTALNL
ncbi:MAG: putative 4-hydroxy-4-methyl-2-oxoglutarate aldolase [Gammaproteobacteria bacterium]|nr:putative 4-hydroxy-4-methyl-2-oxoglutarate aldolase [Gammaproteobacteria bacterium]